MLTKDMVDNWKFNLIHENQERYAWDVGTDVNDDEAKR
jgi:hypothetical protein